MAFFSLSVVACDPLVSTGDTSGGSGSATGSWGSSSGGSPGSVTNSVPPGSSTTTPTGCVQGSAVECACRGGGSGEQLCEPGGIYGACECDVPWGTSGSTGWDSGSTGWGSDSGESSDSGSESSTGGQRPNPPIPELPPGEECLGLDLPCVGHFDAGSDAVLESLSTCSWVQGGLDIRDEVSTLEPLVCLQRVDLYLSVGYTSVSDLSGLSALHDAYGLAVFGNSQLTAINAPTLASANHLYISDNPVLVMLDLPNLVEMDWLDVWGNPLLPECQIEALHIQAYPAGLGCSGNHLGLCAGVCAATGW